MSDNIHSRAGVKPFFGKDEFLSNFHKCTLVVDGVAYNCNEQFYVASKCRFARDDYTLGLVMAESDPVRIKRLGKHISNFNRIEWDRRRVEVMTRGLNAKFRQNPSLRVQLVSTAPLRLVEASPTDGFWGAQVGKDDELIWTPERCPGKNVLGNLLMDLRLQLLSEGGAAPGSRGRPGSQEQGVPPVARGKVDSPRVVRHPCGVRQRYSRGWIRPHHLRSLPGGLVRVVRDIMVRLVCREIAYRNPLYLYR